MVPKYGDSLSLPVRSKQSSGRAGRLTDIEIPDGEQNQADARRVINDRCNLKNTIGLQLINSKRQPNPIHLIQ